jgi:hypothetical protein
VRGKGCHERRVSYAPDADAPDHRGPIHVQSTTRGAGRTADVRRDPQDPPFSQQARALPLERRVDMGADG